MGVFVTLLQGWIPTEGLRQIPWQQTAECGLSRNVVVCHRTKVPARSATAAFAVRCIKAWGRLHSVWRVSSARILAVPETTSKLGQTLAKVPIFSGLSESELGFLTQRAVSRQYTAGEMIFGEGDACAGLFVVEAGHVRIFKSSAGGREQVLSIDGPGSSIAEVPVFDGGAYPASAIAVDDVTLLFVSRQDFQAVCLAHPQVPLKVLRVVGARLRKLVGIIEELSFTTVRHRLAAHLLRLAQKSGKRSAAGVEVALPTTNQELAAQIGTVRELVSRNLSRLQAEGMLKIDGRNVLIRNLKALEDENLSEEK